MSALGDRRRERLRQAHLYVVSGARESRGDLAFFLDAVLRGGADIVQLREKEAEAADLMRWGETFRDAAARNDALFIVNDRVDVAFALGADGVHVGQDDVRPHVARQILGEDAVIGISTHSADQFDGVPDQADYACAGPVYETPTKPGRPATGLSLIEHAAVARRAGEQRPWFAIGGLNESTVPAVVAAGASRIVVVRAVDRDDPESAARRLRALVRNESCL